MAQADGVVANGTGAAVRSDLNGQLAALFTNHSGSTEPGTTYAYQWWADTNANVLKLRNSSNDGWVTLRELDGTMLIEDGSASTPGLAFADDTNTGIFSDAADRIGFATGGVERFRIETGEVIVNEPSNDVNFRVESNGNTHMLFVDGGSDRVGIGTSSPGRQLQINGDSDTQIRVVASSGGTAGIQFGDADDSVMGGVSFDASDDSLQLLGFNNSERLRIDSSGRIGIGTASPTTSLHIQGANTTGKGQFVVSSASAGTEARMTFIDGSDDIAEFSTNGDDFYFYNERSSGAFQFYTGGSTERMRLDSSGRLLVGLTSAGSGSMIEAKTGTVTSSSSYLGLKAFTANMGYSTTNKTSSMLSGFDGNAIHGVDIGYSYDGSGYYLAFATNVGTSGTPTEAMRIQRTGRVNIVSDYTTGAPQLYVENGTSASGQQGLQVKLSSSSNNTSSYIFIGSSDGNKFYVLGNGNVQNANNSYGAISDAKLKENIVDASSQWDDIKGIRVRNYNFIEGETHTQIGVVAQEVETVSPGLVTESPDCETVQVPALDENGEAVLDKNGEAVITTEVRDLGTTTKSVNYSVLYMKAVKALQEAMNRIETLEAKIAALEAG